MPALAAEIPLSERRSSYELMSRDTKAMQDEDTANPGMLSVLDGEALWSTKAGAANRACADCHGDATNSMKGVAARYPAFDDKRARAGQSRRRINICRTEQQKAPALAFEGRELLALTTFVARQSRGMPIESKRRAAQAVHRDGTRAVQRGARASSISPARSATTTIGARSSPAYPCRRRIPPAIRCTGWNGRQLGSLQRRLRNCLIGMRAETYAYGSPEYVALETFLMWRARGMPLETPAVRP